MASASRHRLTADPLTASPGSLSTANRARATHDCPQARDHTSARRRGARGPHRARALFEHARTKRVQLSPDVARDSGDGSRYRCPAPERALAALPVQVRVARTTLPGSRAARVSFHARRSTTTHPCLERRRPAARVAAAALRSRLRTPATKTHSDRRSVERPACRVFPPPSREGDSLSLDPHGSRRPRLRWSPNCYISRASRGCIACGHSAEVVTNAAVDGDRTGRPSTHDGGPKVDGAAAPTAHG